MRSVASFIIITAVAFVAVRFVSSTEPHQPQSRHAVVSTQYIPRYNQAYYYGAPARRPQSRLQRLLLDYLRAQVRLRLLSPRTTAVAPEVATSTSTMTSTTTSEPEPETCIGLSGVPAEYQGWLQYKGCCYQAGESTADFNGAFGACDAQDVYLANKNARGAADREALFVDLLGLSGDVWLDLYEFDGAIVWVDVPYVLETGVTFEGVQSTSQASTYSGADPNVLTFRTPLEANTLQAEYACEYCPPS